MNKQELMENNTGLIYHTLKQMNKFNNIDEREYYYEVGLIRISESSK